MRTYEHMKENRLARMREGKNAGEIVELLSDDSIRLALVPLTDGEWLKSLSIADKLDAGDNAAGLVWREETQKKAIIFYAAREMSDWQEPFFQSLAEVDEVPQHDINHIYDIYLEMVAQNSPSLYMLGDEEVESLKKVWARIEWNELSGQQRYAAMRFLNSIRNTLLQDSLSGSHSTSNLTTKNDSEIPVENAEENMSVRT